MDNDTAKGILQSALAQLINRDLATFGETIAERTIMFRIAHYMATIVEEPGPLTVDCEYNRHGDSIKILPPKTEVIPGNGEQVVAHRFSPDIVLHERRSDLQNILVCEIKKIGNHRGATADRDRLAILTDSDGAFRYQLGPFIEIDQSSGSITVEYFSEGDYLEGESIT